MRIRILYLLFFILIFCNCNGQQVEKTEAGKMISGDIVLFKWFLFPVSLQNRKNAPLTW